VKKAFCLISPVHCPKTWPYMRFKLLAHAVWRNRSLLDIAAVALRESLDFQFFH